MADFHETRARYTLYREESFAATAKVLREQANSVEVFKFALDPTFKISHLDRDAVINWKMNWQKHFNWEFLQKKYYRHIGRFEIALWLKDKVQAFAIGKTSDGSEAVQIHFVERFGLDLKGLVVPIIIDAAENYAELRGKQNIKIRDPLPGALPIYTKLGFTLVKSDKKVPYYIRKVAP